MIRLRSALLFTLLFAFLANSTLRGAEPAAGPAPDPGLRDRLIDEGLRALYYLDYPTSQARFRELETAFPDDPLGPYAVATALWWELTNEFDENNPDLEKLFLQAAARATLAAQTAIKRSGDPDGAAHLCLGGALGLEARWEAIQGEWLAAYRHGRQAFKAQKKAIDINPKTYDAYLGVGIFHYYTATLPAVVKVLAKLIFGGNKQQGLDEIRLAMDKGRFSRTAAKLFMVGILVNNEKDTARALELLREGKKEYPGSPFFHLLEMLVLEEAKDWPALEMSARDFLERVEKHENFYDTKYQHRALLSLGDASLGKGDCPTAIDIYNLILKDAHVEDRWITMTYLNRGRANDRLGNRDTAVLDYRIVLQRRDVWQLHEKAEKFLKEPDRP